MQGEKERVRQRALENKSQTERERGHENEKGKKGTLVSNGNRKEIR